MKKRKEAKYVTTLFDGGSAKTLKQSKRQYETQPMKSPEPYSKSKKRY